MYIKQISDIGHLTMINKCIQIYITATNPHVCAGVAETKLGITSMFLTFRNDLSNFIMHLFWAVLYCMYLCSPHPLIVDMCLLSKCAGLTDFGSLHGRVRQREDAFWWASWCPGWIWIISEMCIFSHVHSLHHCGLSYGQFCVPLRNTKTQVIFIFSFGICC